jgi:hypothetical protein
VVNAAGAPDPNYDGTLTIRLASNATGATLGGTLTATADEGVATFAGLSLDTIGSGYTIEATASGLTAATSSAIQVIPPADRLVLVTPPPAYIVAGGGFELAVAAEDGQGLVDPSYTGPITLSLGNNPDGDTLGGTLTVGAVKGVAIFSKLTLDRATSGLTIQAYAGTLTATVSNALTVLPATATSLVVQYPPTTTAGAPHALTVTVDDANGNIVTSYAGTIHFTSSDPTASLPADYTFTPADAGVHTFVATLGWAGSQTITVSDVVLRGVTGQAPSVTVNPGPAVGLAIEDGGAQAGSATQVYVRAVDAYRNTAPSYTGTVHFTSTDTHAVLPADYTFTPQDEGYHTFTAVFKTSGYEYIRARDTAHPTRTGLAWYAINAAWASTFKLVGPTAATAGTTQSLTVTAYDRYGNISTYYGGTVVFTSNDPQAVLPDAYTFTWGDNGQHTFTVALKTVGSRSIQVSDHLDPWITGSIANLFVSTAAMNGFRVVYPSVSTAGESHYLGVVATDAYGNVVPGYTGTIHFASTDANAVLPSNYHFAAADHGSHTFRAILKTAGTEALTVTDVAQGTLSGQGTGREVQPSALRGFVVTFPSSLTAGEPGALLVIPVDAFGNVVTNYAGTIRFTSDDSHAKLPAAYTFTAADRGSHVFIATLDTAGVHAIRASDTAHSSLTGLAPGLVVHPGAATRIAVSGFPAATTANTSHPFVVTVFDAYGNVATGYTGTIHFSSDDPLAALPADWAFSAADAGTRTFSATFRTTGRHVLKVVDAARPTFWGEETDIDVA